jgi:hypothetical protein
MSVDRDPVAEAVRDLMLERASGMRPATRRKVLGQRWWGSQRDIPPALYFDSAETPPTFFGLTESALHEVRCEVRGLVKDGRARADAIAAILRTQSEAES